MGKRTLDNCRLVRKFGRPVQYDGVCEGFGKGDYDDEPCEKCKDCPLHYLNAESEENNVRGISESCENKNAVRFGQVTPTPHPVIFYFERVMGDMDSEYF